MSDTSTVIDYGSWLYAANIDALKAIPVTDLHTYSLALVHNVSTENPGGGGGGLKDTALCGPQIYMYRPGLIQAEYKDSGASVPQYPWEPRVVKPDDVVDYASEGRWVCAPYVSEIETPYFSEDVVFAGSGTNMKMTMNSTLAIPSVTKIDIRGWSEEFAGTASNTGFEAGTSDSGASADAIWMLARGNAGLGVTQTEVISAHDHHLQGDARYNQSGSFVHDDGNSRVGSRRMRPYEYSGGGSITWNPAILEDCIIKIVAGTAVSMSTTTSAYIGAYITIWNHDADASIQLNFTGGLNRRWFQGAGGVSYGTGSITMARGGVATIYYEASSVVSITGSGLS